MFLKCLKDVKKMLIVFFLFIFNLSERCLGDTGKSKNVGKTMFEALDEKLTRMLTSPKPDESKHLLKLIKLYQKTMIEIQKMVENNDMAMVKAVESIYDSGGPKFLQIRINDQTFKKLGWSEEDLDQYYNLRLMTDQVWFELRRVLFGAESSK